MDQQFLSRVLGVGKLKAKHAKAIKEYSYLNCINKEVQIIDSTTVRRETSKDEILRKVREYTMLGWPNKIEEVLKPFKNRRLELSVKEDCVLWGYRVIIPNSLRLELLEELHGAHLGVVKMKTLARSYFWWPDLDKDIKNIAKACKGCSEFADNPPKSTLHVWKWPQGPNHRIHIDFCGPINGHMYLIITDAYSKLILKIDIKEMRDITTKSTIKALQEYICSWGIPHQVVSDNGPAFTSSQFKEFVSRNAIKG